ncbi:hypothetical protein HQ520_19220 [bacterium]|nr:hypothetical protein [bacterium]
MRSAIAGLLMMCVVLMAAVTLGAPQGVPLSDAESLALAARESAAVAAADWGQAMAAVADLRKAFAPARPLSSDEMARFALAEDASLGDLLAGGVARRILLFIPDRILDVLDVLSLSVGIPIGLGFEAHVTRWVSVGIGGSGAIALHWSYNRNLALAPVGGAWLSLGPLAFYSLSYAGLGTGWSQGRPGGGGQSFNKFGIFSIQDEMVQEGWTDPFGVGVGHILEIHPIEIADFVVGLVTLGFVDISGDDFARPDATHFKTGLAAERAEF